LSVGSDLFWHQAEALFSRWQALVERNPEQVRRECLLYIRWLTRLKARDPDSALVAEVIREMIIEILIDLAE